MRLRFVARHLCTLQLTVMRNAHGQHEARLLRSPRRRARTPTATTIKKAYRKLAMKYPPRPQRRRRGGRRASSRKRPRPTTCCATPDKRPRYDRYGHAGLEGFDGGAALRRRPLASSTCSATSSATCSAAASAAARSGGRDLQYQLEIDLVEAARGVKQVDHDSRAKNCARSAPAPARSAAPSRPRAGAATATASSSSGRASSRVQQTCPGCGGRGVGHHRPVRPLPRRRAGSASGGRSRSTIPPGVDTGMRVRRPRRGRSRATRAPPRRPVRRHPRRASTRSFQRDGDHLICQVPITFSQAALGARDRGADARRPAQAHVAAGHAARRRAADARARACRTSAAAGAGDLLVQVARRDAAQPDQAAGGTVPRVGRARPEARVAGPQEVSSTS